MDFAQGFERFVQRLPLPFQKVYWAAKLELDPNSQRYNREQDRARYERKLLADGCDPMNARNAANAHVAHVARTLGYPVYLQRERKPGDGGGPKWRALIAWLLSVLAADALGRLLDLVFKSLRAVRRPQVARPS